VRASRKDIGQRIGGQGNEKACSDDIVGKRRMAVLCGSD